MHLAPEFSQYAMFMDNFQKTAKYFDAYYKFTTYHHRGIIS
jgi:hypothetical protein